MKVAGLFAGIGGFEEGFRRAGHEAEFFCEWWEPAQRVLATRFGAVPLHGDITTLKALPKVDIVAAGFPCTDLSQAGRTVGIDGSQSGLVRTALGLVRKTPPREWLVLENVRNMIPLHNGRALTVMIELLERAGFRWAYRVVDSRFSGVPQRRQRVILVASKQHDPRGVLFADDAGERAERFLRRDAWGFYWTEGLRGLGWCQDGVPTLKGGSTIGIPSPPGVWLPQSNAEPSLVTPSIASAERIQGFRVGWTLPASDSAGRRAEGVRWKLVGNAVTVPVAQWLGERLAMPGEFDPSLETKLLDGEPWPLAAHGRSGRRWRVDVSMWPQRRRYRHLADLLSTHGSTPMSARGSSGFLSRLERSSLKVYPAEFKSAVRLHVSERAVA